MLNKLSCLIDVSIYMIDNSNLRIRNLKLYNDIRIRLVEIQVMLNSEPER
jgi:hypothetical protein